MIIQDRLLEGGIKVIGGVVWSKGWDPSIHVFYIAPMRVAYGIRCVAFLTDWIFPHHNSSRTCFSIFLYFFCRWICSTFMYLPSFNDAPKICFILIWYHSVIKSFSVQILKRLIVLREHSYRLANNFYIYIYIYIG